MVRVLALNIPLRKTRISLGEGGPTPAHILTQARQEDAHARISAGTKRALLAGSGLFNSLQEQNRYDPHLSFQGGAWRLRALADTRRNLAPKEWFVMVEGHSVEGAVTVWRNPVVHPMDLLETWTARPWPADDEWPLHNSLICSTQGLGVTALAGGGGCAKHCRTGVLVPQSRWISWTSSTARGVQKGI